MTGGQWASRPSPERSARRTFHRHPADSRSRRATSSRPPTRSGTRSARGSRPRASCRGHVRPGERRGRHAARAARFAGHFSVVSEVERRSRVLATMPGKSSVEIGVKRGSSCPCTARRRERWRWLSGTSLRRGVPLAPRTADPETIVSPAVLRRELDLVRRRGWAVAPNEALIGVNALAAPVFGATGALVGTVSDRRFHPVHRGRAHREQVERVGDAGWRISAALGHRARARSLVDMRV